MSFAGPGTALGLAEESTYGTAASRTRWLAVISAGLRKRQQSIRRPNLRRGTGGLNRKHYRGRKEVGGPFETEVMYSDFGMLLYALLGGKSTTEDSGTYTHTYTLADELPSLTSEVIRGEGRNGSTALSEVFKGCILNSGSIRGEAHGLVKMQGTFLAQDADDRSAAPTVDAADWPTGVPLHCEEASNVSWNSLSLPWRSFELSVDNGHVFRDRAGASTTARPTRTNDRQVRLRLSLDQVGADLYHAIFADTESDLTLTFTNGDLSFAITLHNAIVDSSEAAINGPGLISETVEFIPQADDTNTGLSIVVINTQASAIG